ncbi:MAG: PepSY domain-containing protein [Sulfuriferula sp.]|nr:PepSY domain-containing protein [Sulfuriferula sp.]
MKAVHLITLALLSPLAHADADCVAHPKAEWMKEDTIKKALIDEGYTIKKFKVDGNCYEMYGRNKAGKRAEIYFDTVTGKPVKAEIEK